MQRVAAWAPEAEEELRAAVAERVRSGDRTAAAAAWSMVGSYLLYRAQSGPAVLAYAEALVTGEDDEAASNDALRGLVHALNYAGAHFPALAAMAMLARRGRLDDFPDPWSWLAQQPGTRRQHRNAQRILDSDRECRKRIGGAVRRQRRRLRHFPTRFLAGELRFDAPDQVFAALRDPDPAPTQADASAMRLTRHYRMLLARRIVLLGLPVVAVAAAVIATGRRPGGLATVVLSIVAVGYLAAAVFAVRLLLPLLREQRLNRQMQARLVQHIRSTHADAYAILERFATDRTPFGLLLRSFETEAAEQVTPEGTRRVGPTRAEWVTNQIMSGAPMVSGHGYRGDQRWVINSVRGLSELERWLQEKVNPHLPVVAVSNAAAGALGRLGLPRIETSNENWLQAVRLLVSAAPIVFVECTVASAGLLEELQLLRNRGRSDRTLVVLPSRAMRKDIEESRNLRAVLVDGPLPDGPPVVLRGNPALRGFSHVVAAETLPRGELDVELLVSDPSSLGDPARAALMGDLATAKLVLDNGANADAAEMLLLVLAHAQESRQADVEAEAVFRLGLARARLDDQPGATEYFRRAVDLAAEAGDPALEGLALGGLAALRRTADAPTGEVRGYLERAARLQRAGAEPLDLAWTLGRLLEVVDPDGPDAVAIGEELIALREQFG